MAKSEDELIAWIAERFPALELPIGIGDDMAMLPARDKGLLVTSDMLMDGVHFDSAVHSPEQIGRKALAVNLSDCAAMAVRSRWAMVSVALPNVWTMAQAQGLFLGIEALAREYECAVIGGDTNSWDRPLVIDVTVIAEPWPGIEPVRRSGARTGDMVCVSGAMGGSLASGRHLRFMPRVREARWLAQHLGTALHAMMDLSDGLSVDAGRMAKASGLGICLVREKLLDAASDDARQAAMNDGRDLLDHVLNDGEDYELLFTVEAAAWQTFLQSASRETAGPGVRWQAIGKVVRERGFWLEDEKGRREAVEPRGWQHFKS